MAQRLVFGVLLSGLLAAGPVASVHAQQTSGKQSLQRRQQRDAALRQQDIREQQRQRAASQQLSRTSNPLLQQQLKSAGQAQHQRYIERRHAENTKYPDIPPAPRPPANSPSPPSSVHARPPLQPSPASSAPLPPAAAGSG